jgi:DNA-binding Lrp family transcriptional regulator
LEAIVLVNTDAATLWQVLEAVFKVEGVKTAYAVTGQFDAVIVIEFPDLDQMGKIIGKMHHVKGVLRTQTLITIPPPPTLSNVPSSLPEEERTGPNTYSDR